MFNIEKSVGIEWILALIKKYWAKVVYCGRERWSKWKITGSRMLDVRHIEDRRYWNMPHAEHTYHGCWTCSEAPSTPRCSRSQTSNMARQHGHRWWKNSTEAWKVYRRLLLLCGPLASPSEWWTTTTTTKECGEWTCLLKGEFSCFPIALIVCMINKGTLKNHMQPSAARSEQ